MFFPAVRDASSKMADVSLVAPVQTMKTRKILKYESKVISFDWSPDQRHIVSGGEVRHFLKTFTQDHSFYFSERICCGLGRIYFSESQFEK